eukprot:CAMPEP_0172843634 /NCGR_PEP_ID=MMETSP1075-20121228/31618_1 /TAXON_ID=2916 /ORGANISM="Ceratium fusus, Strain PA161109" /LENGTH=64 /DNA_ID=CAMNT_0013687939 /DNA_START=165 /DNA_END=356 /DNA_ORIENTATION=-
MPAPQRRALLLSASESEKSAKPGGGEGYGITISVSDSPLVYSLHRLLRDKPRAGDIFGGEFGDG